MNPQRERISGLGRALAFVIALVFFVLAALIGIAGAHAQLRWGSIIAVLVGLLGTIPFALGAMIMRSSLTGRRVRALEDEDAARADGAQ